MIICLIIKVNIPAKMAEPTINKIFNKSLSFKTSSSIEEERT